MASKKISKTSQSNPSKASRTLTLSKILWPDENVRKLIKLVGERQQEFIEPNVRKACEALALLLPDDPRRPGCKYSASEIRKKLKYLMSAGEQKFTWDDLVRDGRKCFIWKQSKPTLGLVRAEMADGGLNEDADITGVSITTAAEGIHGPANQTETGQSHRDCLTMNDALRGRRIPSVRLLEESQSQSARPNARADHELRYVNYSSLSHKISDTEVKDRMRRILSKMNIAVACLSEALDFGTLASPQWDIIQVRYPETSGLLHKVLGVPEKGRLSDTFAQLGLGQLSFTDWIKALVGMAIHTWVFQSAFPKCLTSPEKSLEILGSILDGKGLLHLKKNLLWDMRFQLLEDQRSGFPNEAADLAIKLGGVLRPMLIRHDIEDQQIGAPNIGEAGNTWNNWRSKMQDLFLECLELKALQKLDGDFVEYRYPITGMECQDQFMEFFDPRQRPEGRLVYVAFLPTIIAPDRMVVLSRGVVIPQ